MANNIGFGIRLQTWCLICGIWSSQLLAADFSDLIGTTPPDWGPIEWVNSKPLQLRDLRGKVVLIRWWTAPGCAFCEATAPALNEFHDKYASRGLVVIGLYHDKAKHSVHGKDIENYIRQFGFEFPVGIDQGWKTLDRWWRDSGDRPWTSVSFLLDQKGTIQYVHPGGQYTKGDREYLKLRKKIEELILRPALPP